MKFLLISSAIFASVFSAPQGYHINGNHNRGEYGYVSNGYPDRSSAYSNVIFDYYFHVSPEQEEPPPPPTVFIQPKPELRYKIVFVKVPPSIPKVQETLELPAQVKEKTIVYVLVKRPEDPKDIVLPEPETTPASEPEVFVVKYKNEKDIDSKIVSGVSDSKLYGKKGFSEDSVNRELSKVKEVTDLKLINV